MCVDDDLRPRDRAERNRDHIRAATRCSSKAR
jgi:hypothetical protein